MTDKDRARATAKALLERIREHEYFDYHGRVVAAAQLCEGSEMVCRHRLQMARNGYRWHFDVMARACLDAVADRWPLEPSLVEFADAVRNGELTRPPGKRGPKEGRVAGDDLLVVLNLQQHYGLSRTAAVEAVAAATNRQPETVRDSIKRTGGG